MFALCEYSSSVVLSFSQVGKFIKTTVGIRQGCLPSHILLHMLLDKTMQKTLNDHHTSMSIGGRLICQLLMGGSNGELQDLINRFVGGATAYGTCLRVHVWLSRVSRAMHTATSGAHWLCGSLQYYIALFHGHNELVGTPLIRKWCMVAKSEVMLTVVWHLTPTQQRRL